MLQYKKRRKYKYNLHSAVSYTTPYRLNTPFDNGFIALNCEGRLEIRPGYAWDGPSGPAIDTKNFMRASLVHDALYQLMREQVLPQSARKAADDALRSICRTSGMCGFRAWYVYLAVRLFAAQAAKPDLQEAP